MITPNDKYTICDACGYEVDTCGLYVQTGDVYFRIDKLLTQYQEPTTEKNDDESK